MTTPDGKNPIVVGVDGTEHAKVALSRAAEEARLRSAPLHVVYVSDVSPAQLLLADGTKVSTRDLAAAKAAAVWETVDEILEGSDLAVTRVDLEGYPADELVDYVNSANASLLVVGTRGRGKLRSTFLGSTSSKAVERVECDVLVAKRA